MKKKRPMGQFRTARHEFDMRARAYGIDPSQPEGCGWKDPRAMIAWYFWYSGWMRRHSWDRKRAADKSSAAQVDKQS